MDLFIRIVLATFESSIYVLAHLCDALISQGLFQCKLRIRLFTCVGEGGQFDHGAGAF